MLKCEFGHTRHAAAARANLVPHHSSLSPPAFPGESGQGRRACRTTMKRSRTCQCLVELDTPKRSRSTPDLGVLQRKHDVFGRRQNPPNAPIAASAGLDAALRFFRQAVPKPGVHRDGCGYYACSLRGLWVHGGAVLMASRECFSLFSIRIVSKTAVLS